MSKHADIIGIFFKAHVLEKYKFHHIGDGDVVRIDSKIREYLERV